MKVLIVGYGNIGRYLFKELKHTDPYVYDPFISEYSVLPVVTFDIAFICVPSESREDGRCDVSVVEESVKSISADVIVIKSTVPVGTTDRFSKMYSKKCVFSPEYYGTTQHSENSPDFLVLGGDMVDCAKVAQLYYKIKNASYKIYFTNIKTAELAKYMENCFLALKVTFCNEFASIARAHNIFYEELREIFVLDKRMGPSHTFVLNEQPYYDSHCLNKDIPALIYEEKERCPLIQSMHNINLERKTQSLPPA